MLSVLNLFENVSDIHVNICHIFCFCYNLKHLTYFKFVLLSYFFNTFHYIYIYIIIIS